MTNYPKAPFGWKLVYTKEAGWTTPEMSAAALGAVQIDGKTFPIIEYPGWVMLLQRSVVDPKLWLLNVAYAPDGKTLSPDTTAVFARSSDEQPQMPMGFSWGTMKWWLLGAGVAVALVAAAMIWKWRSKRRARPRKRLVKQPEVAVLPPVVQ